MIGLISHRVPGSNQDVEMLQGMISEDRVQRDWAPIRGFDRQRAPGAPIGAI